MHTDVTPVDQVRNDLVGHAFVTPEEPGQLQKALRMDHLFGDGPAVLDAERPGSTFRRTRGVPH